MSGSPRRLAIYDVRLRTLNNDNEQVYNAWFTLQALLIRHMNTLLPMPSLNLHCILAWNVMKIDQDTANEIYFGKIFQPHNRAKNQRLLFLLPKKLDDHVYIKHLL